MLFIQDNIVYLTRGDSASLVVTIKDLDGNVYTLQTGDELMFTMKVNCETDEAVLSKDITADSTITILPSDTENLRYGDYVFDVQLTQAGGEVYTVIPPSILRIAKEVTFGGTP